MLISLYKVIIHNNHAIYLHISCTNIWCHACCQCVNDLITGLHTKGFPSICSWHLHVPYSDSRVPRVSKHGTSTMVHPMWCILYGVSNMVFLHQKGNVAKKNQETFLLATTRKWCQAVTSTFCRPDFRQRQRSVVWCQWEIPRWRLRHLK